MMLCAAIVALLVLITVGLTAASALAENPPHCQPVTFTENSGNGPTYHVQICGALKTALAAHHWQLIVDGSPLQNGAVIFGQQIPTAPLWAALADYPNPNSEGWHCVQDGHLYSFDCISEYGFTYGGLWAFLTSLYRHPNPSTDYVDGELYFNQNSPNGMADTAQWEHRLIAVNDGQLNALVAPEFWKVSDSQANPPAPVYCLIVSGPRMGDQFPCTTQDQTSILDAWRSENVLPARIPW